MKVTDLELKDIIKNACQNEEIEEDVFNIVKKVIKFPRWIPFTVAKLIKYNAKEVIVNPLRQGEIVKTMEKVCKQLNINIVSLPNGFGGLAYHSKFKKK